MVSGQRSGQPGLQRDRCAGAEPTIAGQRNLLQQYFVPTEDERAQGLKEPTRAHQAIARLCKAGYIKVILTTNFDRLMEQALEAAEVTYFTITSAQEISGAPSLTENGVFVIKVHGDYLKANVRNSDKDLIKYPPALKKYLDRIFDDFGLITCGWSGNWDHALRQSIGQSPNRRYMMYFANLSAPTGETERLIEHRRGRTILNMDADSFFQRLETKVLGLEDASWVPPQTLTALAAEVKLCFGNLERYQIRLQDLLEHEADHFHKQRLAFAHEQPQPEDAAVPLERLLLLSERIETITSTLLKYDHEERLVNLWFNSLWNRIPTRAMLQNSHVPDIQQLIRMPTLKATMHFLMDALRYERWRYLKRFLRWGMLNAGGRFFPGVRWVRHVTQEHNALNRILKTNHTLPATRVLFEALVKESVNGLDAFFVNPQESRRYYFLLADIFLALANLYHDRNKAHLVMNRGAFLDMNLGGWVIDRVYDLWFREHREALRDVFGDQLMDIAKRFEEEATAMAEKIGMHQPVAPYVGFAKLFEDPTASPSVNGADDSS